MKILVNNSYKYFNGFCFLGNFWFTLDERTYNTYTWGSTVRLALKPHLPADCQETVEQGPEAFEVNVVS